MWVSTCVRCYWTICKVMSFITLFLNHQFKVRHSNLKMMSKLRGMPSWLQIHCPDNTVKGEPKTCDVAFAKRASVKNVWKILPCSITDGTTSSCTIFLHYERIWESFQNKPNYVENQRQVQQTNVLKNIELDKLREKKRYHFLQLV